MPLSQLLPHCISVRSSGRYSWVNMYRRCRDGSDLVKAHRGGRKGKMEQKRKKEMIRGGSFQNPFATTLAPFVPVHCKTVKYRDGPPVIKRTHSLCHPAGLIHYSLWMHQKGCKITSSSLSLSLSPPHCPSAFFPGGGGGLNGSHMVVEGDSGNNGRTVQPGDAA